MGAGDKAEAGWAVCRVTDEVVVVVGESMGRAGAVQAGGSGEVSIRDSLAYSRMISDVTSKIGGRVSSDLLRNVHDAKNGMWISRLVT